MADDKTQSDGATTTSGTVVAEAEEAPAESPPAATSPRGADLLRPETVFRNPRAADASPDELQVADGTSNTIIVGESPANPAPAASDEPNSTGIIAQRDPETGALTLFEGASTGGEGPITVPGTDLVFEDQAAFESFIAEVNAKVAAGVPIEDVLGNAASGIPIFENGAFTGTFVGGPEDEQNGEAAPSVRPEAPEDVNGELAPAAGDQPGRDDEGNLLPGAEGRVTLDDFRAINDLNGNGILDGQETPVDLGGGAGIVVDPVFPVPPGELEPEVGGEDSGTDVVVDPVFPVQPPEDVGQGEGVADPGTGVVLDPVFPVQPPEDVGQGEGAADQGTGVVVDPIFPVQPPEDVGQGEGVADPGTGVVVDPVFPVQPPEDVGQGEGVADPGTDVVVDPVFPAQPPEYAEPDPVATDPAVLLDTFQNGVDAAAPPNEGIEQAVPVPLEPVVASGLDETQADAAAPQVTVIGAEDCLPGESPDAQTPDGVQSILYPVGAGVDGAADVFEETAAAVTLAAALETAGDGGNFLERIFDRVRDLILDSDGGSSPVRLPSTVATATSDDVPAPVLEDQPIAGPLAEPGSDGFDDDTGDDNLT